LRGINSIRRRERTPVVSALQTLVSQNKQGGHMCTSCETTSVALKKTIGVPVGTCVYSDLDCCDAIFYFGRNPGSNSPRILHPLQDAVRRGCKIVSFNPLREQGLLSRRSKNSTSPCSSPPS
jgi:hypothetical protein